MAREKKHYEILFIVCLTTLLVTQIKWMVGRLLTDELDDIRNEALLSLTYLHCLTIHVERLRGGTISLSL
jgi:hypothetical protein